MTPPVVTKTCPQCGAPYLEHIGYHAERCPGPRQRIVRVWRDGERVNELECDCQPGWRHLETCPLVVGDPDGTA